MIHPTAVISPGAQIAPDVEIGPYCVIGPNVKIGAGSKLMSHVVIDGLTTIGERNTFFPMAAIGHKTQDLKYKEGNKCYLEIGND
ncbi:acyl-[bacterium]|nr:acyl-[acyl-carrier-protein]--UDP-N-acetylglucosamine O-acyltransferase [bacterium]